MKIFSKILFINFLLFAKIFSQSSDKTGTTAAQFLKNEIGAKQIAIGSGIISIVDDVSSLYWNPAGLANIENRSAIFSHSNLFADIKNNFFGFGISLSENDKIGFSALMQSYGKMEITTENNPEGTGDFFSANDVAIGISYATKMVDYFSFGITTKYITQNIYNESSTAIALDFGTQLNTNFNGIFIGMSYTNFGTSLKLEGRDLRKTFDPNPDNSTNIGVTSNLATENWELPVNFKIALGWKIFGLKESWMQNSNHKLDLVFAASHPNDMKETISIGEDYTWNDFLSIRTSYVFGDPNKNFNFGIGFKANLSNDLNMNLDFGVSNQTDFGYRNFITLIVY